MKSFYVKTAVTTALIGAAALILGVGPGPGGGQDSGGPPEGHGPPISETGNNLSVPVVMIKGGFSLNCGVNEFTALGPAQGDSPIWYDENCVIGHDGEICIDEGYYFVQGVHTWQAPCMNRVLGEGQTPIRVFGAWGDNLSGDAKLKVGSPIRVELTLWDESGLAQQEGYSVVKLEPDKLDRESAYGTLAAEAGAGYYAATPILMTPLVHDGDATFGVLHVESGEYVIPAGTNPTAEINATGKIVYGYNLRVPYVGEYDITFVVPNVEFAGCNHTDVCGGDTTTLRVSVVGGGGAGGGGPLTSVSGEAPVR